MPTSSVHGLILSLTLVGKAVRRAPREHEEHDQRDRRRLARERRKPLDKQKLVHAKLPGGLDHRLGKRLCA